MPSLASTDLRADLTELQHRCQTKANAARRAADRRRAADSRTDPRPARPSTDPERRAWEDRLIDSSYWNDAASDSESQGIVLLDDLAGCYDVLARSCAFVKDAGDRRGRLDTALPMLAEAQSALREAINRLQGPEDPDQIEIFEMVRMLAARHRIFLKRYMRADDRADPTHWPARLDRITTRSGSGDAAREKQARLAQLTQVQERIRHGGAALEDWQSLMTLINELVESGVPPSDRAIRELLISTIDELPEHADQPHGFRLVLRELDRFLASADAPSPSHRITEPTEEVAEVGRLLAGRRIALIGGDRRPEAQQALVAGLGLDSLVWIETREHQAVATFEPAISRPEVVLVLLAIRWSSHAFGEVKHLCDRLGKPLVRLPGGYHPNQVASQILAQCGDRLRNA